MLRDKYDLPHVIRVVRQLTIDRLQHRQRLASDRNRSLDVGGGERPQRVEKGGPAVFPFAHQRFSAVAGQDLELDVTIAPGLLAIRGEDIGPAGSQVSGHVFDDHGDAVV